MQSGCAEMRPSSIATAPRREGPPPVSRPAVMANLDRAWPALMAEQGYTPQSPIAAVHSNKERWSLVRDTLWERAEKALEQSPTSRFPRTQPEWTAAILQQVPLAASQLPALYGNAAQEEVRSLFHAQDRSRYQHRQDPQLVYPGSPGMCLGVTFVWMENCGRLPLDATRTGHLTPRAARRALIYQSSHHLMVASAKMSGTQVRNGRTALGVNPTRIRWGGRGDNVSATWVRKMMQPYGVSYRRSTTQRPATIRRCEDPLTALQKAIDQEVLVSRNPIDLKPVILALAFEFEAKVLGRTQYAGHAVGVMFTPSKDGPTGLRFFDPNVGEFDFVERRKQEQDDSRFFPYLLRSLWSGADESVRLQDFDRFPEFFRACMARFYENSAYQISVMGRGLPSDGMISIARRLADETPTPTSVSMARTE
jgi:hypothetical protein